MGSYCLKKLFWWVQGFGWHGGMIGGLITTLFVRPSAIWATVLAILYLSTNVFLTECCLRFEYELQTQQTEQQEESTSTAETSQEDPLPASMPSSSPPPPPFINNTKIRHLRNVPFYLSLMYLMTNLSCGIPGALCVFIWFPCGEQQQDEYPPNLYWITNTSMFPEQVLDWMKNPQLHMLNSFVQLGSDVYLTGSYEGSDNSLYAILAPQQRPDSSNEPIDLGYHNVFDLTRVSDTTLCFVQVDFQQQRQSYYMTRASSWDPQISIGCGNATAGFTTALVNQKQKHSEGGGGGGDRHENVALFSLHGMQGLLWFRLVTEEYTFISSHNRICDFGAILRYDDIVDSDPEAAAWLDCPWDTFAVLSMNTSTMEVTSYSTLYTQVFQPSRQHQPEDMVGDASPARVPPSDIADEYDDDDEEEEEEEGEESHTKNEGAQVIIDDFFENDITEASSASSTQGEDDDAMTITEQDKSLFCSNRHFVTSKQALGALFLSSIPIVISSARAWIRFAIPSASISLFAGIGLLCMCGWGVADPWDIFDGLIAWLMFGTPVWTFVCTYQLVVNPRVSRPPLWWSLYFILTALFAVLLFVEYADVSRPMYFVGERMWSWLVELALFDLPILIIAILTDSRYFFTLAVIACASQASTIAWLVSDPPTSYLYVGVGNIIIAVIFLCIYRSRESLHLRFVRWLSTCARHTCAVEALEDDETDSHDCDKMNTTRLLQNETAEEA
mmetsp:Transcript_16851/g.32019  ORF Transcript_16851/g.32019 Transcript_16851/m.32019 type:complete len:728 (-) Transcript_16851:158-2341(-)